MHRAHGKHKHRQNEPTGGGSSGVLGAGDGTRGPSNKTRGGYLGLHLGLGLDLKLERIVVVGESRVVVQVALESGARRILLLSVRAILLGVGVVLVAIVKRARVVLPRPTADPAKLVLATRVPAPATGGRGRHICRKVAAKLRRGQSDGVGCAEPRMRRRRRCVGSIDRSRGASSAYVMWLQPPFFSMDV